MSTVLQTIESKLHDALHAAFSDVESAEPELEKGAGAVLIAAGAPAPIAAAVDGLLAELLNHFRGSQPAATTAPAPGAIQAAGQATAPAPLDVRPA